VAGKKASGGKERIESSAHSWNMNGFATRLKLVLPMRIRSFVLACCLAIQLLPVAAQAENRLNSAVLRGIVERFTSLHYAQKPLNDSLSRTIFTNYLRRLDPGHYYFLQSDIESFRRYERQVDDMLRRGNPDFALDVFSRFKTRLSERLAMLEEILQEEFDFSKDAQWQLDRKEAPYPKDTEAAHAIWRLKMKFDLLTLTLGGTPLKEAKERVLKRVRGQWKDYSQYDDDDVLSVFLNAMASAYDPHSSYLAPQDLKNFDISIKLSLEGIGAVLRWEDGYTVVNSIVPGGAAFRHGKLQVDDRIIAVAQASDDFESVIDMRLNDVVQLIRGKRGTTVRLEVLRKTEKGFDTIKFAIVRDKIVLKDGEARAHVFTPENSGKQYPFTYRIGVIRLPSFYVDFNDRRRNPANYKSSSRDVRMHLESFVEQGVDGVILDLRGNGGGGLDEAIKMAGLFIGRKPIVVVRQTGGRHITVHRSRENSVYTGPLVILQNRYSASASEILAGAMRDYQRALLVGDTTTFGKGTVQNIVQLPEGYGALKVTIAQFYRVSGASTQNRGVPSDIILPSLNNVREVGEATLDHALPWHSIDAVSFRALSNLGTLVPDLSTRSGERVDRSEFFGQVRSDVQEYLDTVKPLQYTSIRKLQEDHERRRAQREQEIAEAREVEDDSETDSEADAPKATAEIDRDAYLEEGMAILEDSIRIQQHAKNNP